MGDGESTAGSIMTSGSIMMSGVGITAVDTFERVLKPKLKHRFRWQPENAVGRE